MKIRTRLLLFLLPALVCNIALVSMLLAYNWVGEAANKHLPVSLLLIVVFAALTILLMVASLFIVANKIARPVQKLNNSALAIAAGQYGESIQVKGPKEIVELANTLNTMSECLHASRKIPYCVSGCMGNMSAPCCCST